MVISKDDLASVVELLSSLASPFESFSVATKRVKLIEGVASIVGADFWSFVNGTVDPTTPGNAVATRTIDGGFSSNMERADFYRIVLDPDLAGLVQETLTTAMSAGRDVTVRRCDLVPDEAWNKLPVGHLWAKTGFDDFIISAHPLRHGHSAIGFHRRRGSPRFTERDVFIVEQLFVKVDWLHEEHKDPTPAHSSLQLSPRERQVLVFLLEGKSRFDIAAPLKISEHTVVGYIKSIYKKLDVRSQKELMAKFSLEGGMVGPSRAKLDSDFK